MKVYTLNGRVLTNSANDKWLKEKEPDPYNPLNLPANTVRVKTSDGNAPVKGSNSTYESATLVAGTSDIYDVYKSGNNFRYMLYGASNVTEVLGANTSGVTDMVWMLGTCGSLTSVALFDTRDVTRMDYMFAYDGSLTSVPLFDTSNVTNTQYMFEYDESLESIPLFNTSNVTNMNHMMYMTGITSMPLLDTSNVTDMSYMFSICSKLTQIPLFNTSKVTTMNRMCWYCGKVASGALALYQQASTQANPPSNHDYTFYNCGVDTVTGAAELAQIPADWKGE